MGTVMEMAMKRNRRHDEKRERGAALAAKSRRRFTADLSYLVASTVAPFLAAMYVLRLSLLVALAVSGISLMFGAVASVLWQLYLINEGVARGHDLWVRGLGLDNDDPPEPEIWRTEIEDEDGNLWDVTGDRLG